MSTTTPPARAGRGQELRDAVSPRAVVPVLGVLLLQLGFIASYVGALHRAQPRNVPITVVAPTGAPAGVARADLARGETSGVLLLGAGNAWSRCTCAHDAPPWPRGASAVTEAQGAADPRSASWATTSSASARRRSPATARAVRWLRPSSSAWRAVKAQYPAVKGHASSPVRFFGS